MPVVKPTIKEWVRNVIFFFEKVLEYVLLSKYQNEEIGKTIKSNQFSRILVQDSTIVRLPLRLFEIFSGVKNAHSAVCNARIQGIYDLISRRFIKFSIDSYSKNDLSVAFDFPAKKGDLILRDRGYFIIKAMKEFKLNGADSIFRYKHKTLFFNMENNKEINLLEYLSKNMVMDKVVFAGAKEKYQVRILAAPVTEEIANIRRMKAKKESKNKNPSKEVLALMSWNIFITTIMAKEVTVDIVFKLYALRWRIENIFKTWKSNFNFDKIHNVSEQQLNVLLRARLIMIVCINQHFFNPLSQKIKTISDKRLSMMKFMRYISKNLSILNKISSVQNVSEEILQALIRYCTYDKRKRLNFEQKMEQSILEINMIDFSLA